MGDLPQMATLSRRPPHWLHAPQLAVVVSVDDPLRLNRVQLRLVSCDDSPAQDAPLWARVVCAFAGQNRGAFLIPDIDDEVLVVFQNGDPSYPLVIGGLWNGSSTAPAELDGDQNRYKRIRSKNGVTITLDDQQGQETFTVETPGGQHLTLADGPGVVTVQDSNGNTLKMDAAGITLTAAARVRVEAAQVEVSAGVVTVDSAMSTFSGIVKCETLITNAVISASYTPGAGNVW